MKSDQANTEVDSLKEFTTGMVPVALSEFKHLTKKFGFDFGPSFSLIKMIWRGIQEAVCCIEIERDEITNEMDRYIVHPTILDACLQTSVAVEDTGDEDETRPTTFPVRIKRLLLLNRHIPKKTFCHVSKHTHGNWVTYNMNLMDFDGNTLIEVQGFQSTEISTLLRSQKLENVAYETKWVESTIEASQHPMAKAEPEVKIVLNDSHEIGQSFSDLLKKKNPAAHVIAIDVPVTAANLQETLPREITAALASVPTHNSNVQLINFLPVNAESFPASYEAIDHSQTFSFVSTVQVLQAIATVKLESPHIVIVTRNSQVVTPDKETDCFPWASSVLGLRRTASLEFANIRCTTVDLSSESNDLALLVEEVEAVTFEDEVAFRGGKRFVNRIAELERSPASKECPSRQSKSDTNPSICVVLHPRTQEIALKKCTWPRLSEDKIQVNVACTWIIGNINNLFSDSQVVGFSGQVCLVATDKTGIQIGDEVCGMASISKVGNQLQLDADHVIRKPQGMTNPQAATLPVCMVVAFYVIRKILDERQNFCLYIDDTNSGLGEVTALVAKALGQTVFSASQETPNHRKVISAHESMSEKPFTSENRATEVDAAIFFNKPSSKVIQNICQFLKAEGKIIILNENVNGCITVPTDKKIRCESISFTEILQKPQKFFTLWNPVQQLMLSSGLMCQVLQITQHTLDIFQYVHDAKGKDQQILSNYFKMNTQAFASLSFSHREEWKNGSMEILPPGIDKQGFKSDRSYMVVGGIRGFGFEVAKWMAYSGAKNIVLVARSKPSESKLSEVSQLMSMTGANIILHQADASSPECMKALQQRLTTLPSVAGIVHTAMVLKDELITSLNINHFRDVAAPKIKGREYREVIRNQMFRSKNGFSLSN